MTTDHLQTTAAESQPGGARFVRFRELDPRGFVHFDFAIGDPELAVELTLPLAAYLAFCHEQGVVHLTSEQADTVDFERSKWRFGEPGLQE